jgi:hypothetical protein
MKWIIYTVIATSMSLTLPIMVTASSKNANETSAQFTLELHCTNPGGGSIDIRVDEPGQTITADYGGFSNRNWWNAGEVEISEEKITFIKGEDDEYQTITIYTIDLTSNKMVVELGTNDEWPSVLIDYSCREGNSDDLLFGADSEQQLIGLIQQEIP